MRDEMELTKGELYSRDGQVSSAFEPAVTLEHFSYYQNRPRPPRAVSGGAEWVTGLVWARLVHRGRQRLN